MTGRRFSLCSLALFLLAATAAIAQGPDALLSGFEPFGELVLKVDGESAPKARIYRSQRAGAFLVRSAEVESPLMLDIAGRKVLKLDLLKVAERPDGSIDLLSDATLQPVGGFELGAAKSVSFQVDGKQLELVPNPYLLGDQKGTDLLEHDAYYRFLAGKYVPDEAALAKLRGAGKDVRVLTFFGSWCPHCRDHVPLLLKTESMLAGSGIEFDYYGLPDTGLLQEPQAKKWRVNGVPTTIVLVGGQEVGRIPARSWAHPEQALAEILASAS